MNSRLHSVLRRLLVAWIGEEQMRRMMRIRDHLPALIRRFGMRTGFALARQILLPSRGLIEVRVPGLEAPLFVRAGTSDVPTLEEVFVHQQYSLPSANISPTLVIDAGANIGLSVRYFAAQFPAAHIIAIEPELSNFELLRRNTESLPSLTLIRAAVWNRDTRLRITNPNARKWAIQVEESREGDIEAVTLGSLLSSVSATDCVLVKLDVEGAEVEVLNESAKSWLSKVALLIVELHDRRRPGCSEALRRAVEGLDFREYRSGDNIALIRNPPQ